MIINVNQVQAEGKNEFEVIYNNEKKYIAELPFIIISGIEKFDNLRKIKVFDLNKNLIYITKYNYIENKLEEFIPLKYLFTKSQKFNQYKILKREQEVGSIYFEMNAIWNGSYVLECNSEYYNCYSVQDGYIKHIMVYDGENQIAEILKLNVITDGKDNYRIYLKDKYGLLADILSVLVLYVDRLEYNSSYLKIRGESYEYVKTYSRANKYYNPNWVINNFDAKEYFEVAENTVSEVKKRVSDKIKKVFSLIGISIFALLAIVIGILFIILK